MRSFEITNAAKAQVSQLLHLRYYWTCTDSSGEVVLVLFFATCLRTCTLPLPQAESTRNLYAYIPPTHGALRRSGGIQSNFALP